MRRGVQGLCLWLREQQSRRSWRGADLSPALPTLPLAPVYFGGNISRFSSLRLGCRCKFFIRIHF